MKAHMSMTVTAILTAVAEYDMLTPENSLKWAPTEPTRGSFNFARADDVVGYAKRNGMKVRGHVLVWHRQLPDWLCNDWADNRTRCIDTPLSASDLQSAMESHISHLTSRYNADPIYSWDVVNEAISDSPTPTDPYWVDLWTKKLGPGYVKMAFSLAAEQLAPAGVKMFYNDYGIHTANDKSDAVYTMLKKLLDDGVQVDGIGFQMHVSMGYPVALFRKTRNQAEREILLRERKVFGLTAKHVQWTDATEVTNNMIRFAMLGLEVHITEMDVRIYNGNGTHGQRLVEQAVIYQDALMSCLNVTESVGASHAGCRAFVTWGFTDRYTWIEPPAYPADAPLPFDANYVPKPAFFVLQEILQKQSRQFESLFDN